MAVTLNNIKFYRPPSLPVQPLKTHATLPFSPFSQAALPHPLPPQPPAIIPSSHHTASATVHSPSSISNTADSHPVYGNDFDRALDDFLSAKNSKKEKDEKPSSCLPTQDYRNKNHTHIILPDPEILTHTTANLLSSSCTLREPMQSLAEAKPTHPKPRHKSQPPEQPNDLACTTSLDTSPTFCTSEPHTFAPHEPNHDSTHTTIQASAQNSSVPNQERSETSRTSSVPIHSSKPGGATLGNESMDFGEAERASSCPLGELSKRKRSPSAHLSCPPTPLVVVPAPSFPSLLRERFSPQNSDCSQNSKRVVEDLDESDSAPSDDENDADYLDQSMTEDANESLHPSKRRRRSPSDASSASRGVPTKLSSESLSAEQPESPQENMSSETESIPIHGFLQLRTKGTEVMYTLEVSQTHFSLFFADKQMESP